MKYKVGDEVIVHRDDLDKESPHTGKSGVIKEVYKDTIIKYPYIIIFQNGTIMFYNKEEISLNTEEDIDRFWLMRFVKA